MIQLEYSWWGIKNSGKDIGREMLDIVNHAHEFIVVGGYNFTFRASAGARPFFDALDAKARSGIPVLLLFPPALHGAFNPQPNIIRHCLAGGMGVILNPENHSKWLLTESQLYYGSSNFTGASWSRRVEVISLHDHTSIPKKWSKQTVADFNQFLQQEVANRNAPARKMRDYRGLLTSTRNAWSSIKPLIHRLNPSLEKVQLTLSNYDQIQSILKEQVADWFYHYDHRYFETIFSLSSEISGAVDELCAYAYGNLYNETFSSQAELPDDAIVSVYNDLHSIADKVIDSTINRLPEVPNRKVIFTEMAMANLERINKVAQIVNQIIG